jgi:hypothetical protein
MLQNRSIGVEVGYGYHCGLSYNLISLLSSIGQLQPSIIFVFVVFPPYTGKAGLNGIGAPNVGGITSLSP